MEPTRKAPHPIVWAILYLPFGAFSGFVTVALSFLATGQGLSISEGTLLNAAQLLMQWLKWLWAPLVDITLTPRRWYILSTVGTGLGVAIMSALPLSTDALPILLAVIAVTSLINSVVGMSIEALIAGTVAEKDVGKVSGWFQAGNLGGAGLGGGLGLVLLKHLPKPWMGGAILGALFVSCTLLLSFTPDVPVHRGKGAKDAVRAVLVDLRKMVKTKGGLMAGVLCFMPIGTGAAQGLLAQANVAAAWGAGESEVAGVQGFTAGIVTAVGCFIGGWLCQRMHPRLAYPLVGVLMALVAVVMAVFPKTVAMYIALNLVYALVVGLAYAGFTALVLRGMGAGSGATKYNVFASLSNFPLWWLNLALGAVAQRWSPRAMLLAEAGFGVLGVAIFALVLSRVRRSSLPETVDEEVVEVVPSEA